MVKTANDGLSDSYYSEGEIYQMMADGEASRSEVTRRNEREHVRTWNAAIDKLADIIDNNKGVLFTADEIRKFKK